MLSVAIIADDLTGAMDAAAPFAGRGLATRALCRPDAAVDEPAMERRDVVAVNAASRYLDPDRAAERTADVARRLQHLAPALAFKKIDSTLRGNVAAEVLAAARAFDRASILLTPAFPAQGRTMRDGLVQVRGRPLQETPFAADRQPPPRDLAAAFQTLAPAMAVHGGCVDTLPADPPAGILLCDCEDEAALARIACWIADHRSKVLAAGSAGLARALAAEQSTRRSHPAQRVRPSGAALVVVGSQAPEAERQISYLRLDGDPVVLRAPAGQLDLASARQLSAQARVIVLQATDNGIKCSPAAVAAALGRATRGMIRGLSIDTLLLTGGDTALAVLNALDVAAVELAGEIMPGLALASLTYDREHLTLVTKAGGFGNDDALASALDFLGY